jgi:tripartite-type tricarboxylate transporter receptor subunit TctC
VIAKLHQAYSSALADPAVQTRLKQMGSNALALTPAQFAEMVLQERQKYQELVKLSGAKVD